MTQKQNLFSHTHCNALRNQITGKSMTKYSRRITKEKPHRIHS